MKNVTVYAVTVADTGQVRALYATEEAARKTVAALAAQGLDTARLVVEGRVVYGAERLVLSNALGVGRG